MSPLTSFSLQRRFINVNPPGFLDFEHAELVLIGASEDIARESKEAAEAIAGIKEDEMEEVQALGDEKVFQE